jgi:hypothetical protein
MPPAPVDPASLLALLRAAAAGDAPGCDLEHAQNPVAWACDLARRVAAGEGAPALAEAIGALLASPALAEVELGRALQGATRAAPAQAAWRALRGHVEAGRGPAALLVAQAAAQTCAGEGGAPLPAEAYPLALDPATPDEARAWVMRVIGRCDPGWVEAHPGWLLHPDPEVARRRLADALGGLPFDRMAAQLARLTALAAARGAPFAPAVTDTLQAMVHARRAAGR